MEILQTGRREEEKEDLFFHLERMKMAERRHSPDVESKTRTIIVDWMMQIYIDFNLAKETFYLAVDLLDRFLTQRKVERRQLQLVAIGVFLIASKYLDVCFVQPRMLIWLTDNTYTLKQLLQMESLILNQLEWTLTLPTRYSFLREYLNIYTLDFEKTTVVNYVLDSTLMSYSLTIYYPSEVVEAVLYLTVDVPVEANSEVVDLVIKNLRYLKENQDEFTSLQDKYHIYTEYKTILEFLDSLED